MALNFPPSPNINDTYEYNGKTWIWDGTTWISSSTGGVSGSLVSGAKYIQSTPPNVETANEGDQWFDYTMPGLFVLTKVDQNAVPPSYIWVQV